MAFMCAAKCQRFRSGSSTSATQHWAPRSRSEAMA
jgi:hypothetical protein